MDYEPVIGLEVHVQLATKSKLFCGCSTEFGSEPNRNTCPVCFGWPGSLPVLNEQALRFAVKVGLALNCRVSDRIQFDRKNYFYPDLPKAYQISQFEMPINGKGWVFIDIPGANGSVEPQKVGITRAHLEEDAGKLLHEGIKDGSLVDYNRAGIPLLEIVSEPDLRSPEAAYEYLVTLKSILEYLEVSDCNMEEGSLRCDANVSVRPRGETKLGTKVEIKNLNSFKAVQKALQYEIERQSDMLENRERIVQETRLWSEGKGQTFSMRSKEEAHDYRYFPEPDLVPFTVSAPLIEEIRKTIPELPEARARRVMRDFGLSEYDAHVLVQDKKLADYFEACVREKVNPKLVSNWIQSELLALVHQARIGVEECPVQPAGLAGLIRLIENNTISGKIAKDVLPEMFATGKSAEAIVNEKRLVQMTDTKLIEEVARRVIEANAKVVQEFRSGKQQALGFLVGQVMKETKGKANPKLANEILVKLLKAS
ncbi:MAG: Asp-tRNA(Asn)/Glu-tRNA(Gln) amidotransferase subunit GatB [Candidatus Omnitrophica bacterium]|nr:Asp-tRNA(Asn)/Glu-tRNA(Gln) amidotransferase subunit GatB [Candidatus Omnitrophota bacterium]MDD5671959.1 Asp-tRNA(Asn)/Glu-tRNA(Gln) amidotransferase subunit GatB [Candidatus Omnitrophota bacterium]